jgi:hypothetical protein
MLQNKVPTGEIFEVTDSIMKRFQEALTRRDELGGWNVSFLKDIEGKLQKMGKTPKLTGKQMNSLFKVFAALRI